jgi:hypothetical protein
MESDDIRRKRSCRWNNTAIFLKAIKDISTDVLKN